MRCSKSSYSVWSALCVGLIALLGVRAVSAAEVTVRNDDLGSFQSVPIVGDFVAGEEAAAVLTSPCGGSIVALQIVWLAGDPGAPQSIEQAIRVYSDIGTFPNPGPALLTLEAPLMTPGAINEFRFLDEQNTIPIDVPVTAGMNFTVSLEYFNPTDVLGGTPSIPRDNNGCQAGRNALFAQPGFWLDFCDFPTFTGDLAIRAVVDCQDPTGACCDFNAFCTDDVELNDCTAPGSTFNEGMTCAQVTCPTPVGACCTGAGGCLGGRTQAACENAPLNGIYGGNGTTCEDGVCDLRACCMPDGGCDDLIGSECLGQGGTPQVPGSDCVSANCVAEPGACCIEGECFDDTTPEGCGSFSGTWQGPGTTCDPDPCAGDCPKLLAGGQCPACDLNESGLTEGLDIAIMTNTANFGRSTDEAAEPCADVNGSGVIEGLDVALCTSTACFGL